MSWNIVPPLLGSIFCLISTTTVAQHLSPYAITSFDGIGYVLSKSWTVLHSHTTERIWLIVCVFMAIIGAATSIFIILHLKDYLSSELESDSFKLNAILVVWMILLSANVLFLFYYLLFIILFVITAIILIIIATSGGSNFNGGGGSVYVRAHTRKGSFVRSHYRRRPRRF